MSRQGKRARIQPAMVAVLSLALLCGDAQPSQEYKVKAAFIYNFARFIEWPPSVFPSADAPFVIAVLGIDPFNGALEQAVNGKAVGTRRVEIRHFESVDKIGDCQILFVPVTDDASEANAIGKVKNNHVLTIGESDSFDVNGGCLQFFEQDNKVRFEISTDATDQSQVRISSKLLKLARIFKK
jgi:hypothetical protein